MLLSLAQIILDYCEITNVKKKLQFTKTFMSLSCFKFFENTWSSSKSNLIWHGVVSQHNSICCSNVYLNLGWKLFHSYFCFMLSEGAINRLNGGMLLLCPCLLMQVFCFTFLYSKPTTENGSPLSTENRNMCLEK